MDIGVLFLNFQKQEELSNALLQHIELIIELVDVVGEWGLELQEYWFLKSRNRSVEEVKLFYIHL